MTYARWTALTLVLLGVAPVAASAQDVEWLGARYGTRPPASYYEEMRRDPTAFHFRRGRSGRLAVRLQLEGRRGGTGGVAELALGPRDGPVVGTFEVPVLLGLYENSGATPPFQATEIQTAYFGGQPGSITDYYTEVSGSRVTLTGDVLPWRRISQPDSVITDGQSGLFGAPVGGGGAGNFVYELVSLQSVDWGAYDNDGPDGVPNSGDDDGYVDVVAVVHPTRGAECGGPGTGDRVWSHRWSLTDAVGEAFVTATPSAQDSVPFILVDDYTIQPSVACAGGGLNQIGVFTHELGHAFGLPDLYDTDGADGVHSGSGIWDLMASGAWGCNNASPSTPCHMGAWSKEQLGWANVVTLAPDTDHGVLSLPPVETTGTVYRVDANDGSGEYFLLENRQRLGYDQNLFAEGLLVWQVDPDWVAARWPSNTVNGADHMGVWLRQADGLDELGQPGGGRGDAADPFPGQTGNTAFHAVSVPAATSYLGGPTGLTLDAIVANGDAIDFRLSTRFTTVTVRANGSSSPNGLFTVDGQAVDPPATTFVSAPFVVHSVEAVAGEAVGPGERRPFVEWSDAVAEPRVRALVTPFGDIELVAEYGGTQYQLDLTTTGGVAGIEPGSFVTDPASPDLWFDAGTALTRLEALPLAGFQFLGWTGALAGAPNPTTLTMSGPVSAGADFELVFEVATSQIGLTATVLQDLQLVTANGTPPYSWRVAQGALPFGLSLSGTGRITGASLELGSAAVTLEAVDANGLPTTGVVTFDVAAPSIPIEALVSPFLLSGPALTPTQLAFLNWQGNRVAGYDVGDFRAWVLANPSLPLGAYFAPPEVESRTIVIPMTREGAR